MPKINKFNVKKIKGNKIIVEEIGKHSSPFTIFFRKNGGLIFVISFLLSLIVFIIAIVLTISNIKESKVVEYESNGVVVTIDNSDSTIINGIPITSEYASKLFSSNILQTEKNKGVVIKIKEINLNDSKIILYSDKTAIIKYNNGDYLKISPVDNNYGVSEDGTINKNAITKRLTGKIKENRTLGISTLYLSDGSIEVAKDSIIFLVRNSDITNNDNTFYTNLSIVSVPIKKEENKIYYSNGTIKENDYIITDGIKYKKVEEKNIHDSIKIIYYENSFAEVIKADLSIIVENSNHIKYDDDIFEIVDINKKTTEIKDVMDIKNIKLNNTNKMSANYIIVLEETDNYEKHSIIKRLDSEYINFNIDVNGNKINNKALNNNLKNNNDINGLASNNNTYLLYEGKIESLEEVSIKLGMWISYETITNEYMNSTFIGTVKIYVESIS